VAWLPAFAFLILVALSSPRASAAASPDDVGAPAAIAVASAHLAPGQPLTAEIVTGLVESALRAGDGGDRGGAERLEVTIEAPALPLPNHAGRPAEVQLAGMRLEPRSGRFAARLDVRLDSGEAGTVDLAGLARRLVGLPVPAHRIERG